MAWEDDGADGGNCENCVNKLGSNVASLFGQAG